MHISHFQSLFKYATDISLIDSNFSNYFKFRYYTIVKTTTYYILLSTFLAVKMSVLSNNLLQDPRNISLCQIKKQ